jgi:hypothetical protein
MIFDRESTFPYPILSKFTTDYPFARFNLEVSIEDSPTNYIFKIDYEINSDFINDLIQKNKAKIYFLIESKDSKFFETKKNSISIPKNRITLSKKTYIQLVVMATENFSFESNHDLDEFYKNDKKNIMIEKFNILALSNVERFNGDLKKPFKLFEKRVDSSLKSDIKVEFTQECIVLVYRNKDFQFGNFRKKNSLNNHFIYIGLQKALMRFIVDLSPENKQEIYIEELNEPDNPLFRKLFNLMKIKGVDHLNFENIDEVIYKITDKIIEKHFNAIEDLARL